MTQAQPEKRPAKRGKSPEVESLKLSPLPEERLAQIRARSTELKSENLSPYDAYDSDTRWLLRYVDMLRERNEQLTRRRTSFEHKMFTVVTLVMGIAVIGTIAYNLYIQPQEELFPGCTYSTPHSCTSWISDYAEPLAGLPY